MSPETYNKELYELVWQMMDASNLSGIIHALPRVADMVRAELQANGYENTNDFNTHPVWTCIADKIKQLNQTESRDAYHIVNMRRQQQ